MDMQLASMIGLDKAIEILKASDEDFNLDAKTYVLKTPDAFLTLGLDEDENTGKKKLDVKITGGPVIYVETDERPFKDWFVSDKEDE